MSQLSPKARALLSSNRNAFQPSSADRERIRHALRARLGTAVPPPAAGVPAHSIWPLLSGAIVGMGAFGGVLLVALHHGGAAHTAPPPVAIVAPTVSVAPIEPTVEAPPPVASAPLTIVAPKPAVTRSAKDSLAEEVSLLSRATSDLHSGRAAEALKLLDEHRRKFPNGLLAEERRAARAQALCSLGRSSEAEPELARLSPQSPAAARASQICGRSAVAPR